MSVATNIIEPAKNWKLEAIVRGFAQCAACNAALRNLFVLSHAARTDTITVGSECVKVHTDMVSDPVAALDMMLGKWHAKSTYFYKKKKGRTWVIGPKGNRHYLAWAPEGVTHGGWKFHKTTFATMDDAKLTLAKVV